MTAAAAVIAALAGVGSAVASLLTFRMVRRQNRAVTWKVELRREATMQSGGMVQGSRIIVTNAGGASARDVHVEADFDGLRPVATTKDVDSGAALAFTLGPRRLNAPGPSVITITWRGGFGRRRRWQGALV